MLFLNIATSWRLSKGPQISKTKNELVQHMKQFCEHLCKSRPDLSLCRCHIAGWWACVKVGRLHNSCAISCSYLTYMQLLGLTITASLSSLTGSTFVMLFLEYLTSIGVILWCNSEPHIIAVKSTQNHKEENSWNQTQFCSVVDGVIQWRQQDPRSCEWNIVIAAEWNLAHWLLEFQNSFTWCYVKKSHHQLVVLKHPWSLCRRPHRYGVQLVTNLDNTDDTDWRS